jgi:predicted regulator of Ras-like GTPase activity (Roadblock/LC7/MglB family)
VAEDALLAKMQTLQDNVTGITGTAVASRDGLLVRADASGVDPDNLAALAATWLALTQRMSREVGQGTLREAMTRSTGGYVAIYAIGASAVLVVIGDEGLDVARLNRESAATREAIEALLSGPARAGADRLRRSQAKSRRRRYTPIRCCRSYRRDRSVTPGSASSWLAVSGAVSSCSVHWSA